MKAYKSFSTKQTPQTEPIPGKNQVQNNAGGFVFGLDQFKTLERFLILGSEGGSYYVSERKLTTDNAKNVINCINADGKRTVDLIVEVSDSGRAPKNDPAIFALALAASADNVKTRGYALAALGKVCRIPTHLYHFDTYVQQFRGWGRGLKKAHTQWLERKWEDGKFKDRTVKDLAYVAVKYQQRDGFSMRDVLRLTHPKTSDQTRDTLYRYIVDGYEKVNSKKISGAKDKGTEREYQALDSDDLPDIIHAFESLKTATNVSVVVQAIRDNNIPRECIPTQFLTEPKVWEALLEKMPSTALIRNLGNLSKCGLLMPFSNAEKTVLEKLSDSKKFKEDRVHPLSVLLALKTYASGHGLKGSGAWTTVPSVVDRLNHLFYECFNFLSPIGKRFLIAVDCSGSMTWPTSMPIVCIEGAGVIAMAIAKVEPFCYVAGYSTHFKDLGITPSMRLDDVTKKMLYSGGGGTDCAQPWIWALKNKVEVDAVINITDNETWAGYNHPVQALKDYRQKMNRPTARNIVIGMTSTGFTINDPLDPFGLDIVGFDASVPQVVQEFCRG